MRRVVVVGLLAVLAGSFPDVSVARHRLEVMQYETVYSGTYALRDVLNWRDPTLLSVYDDRETTYTWTSTKLETFTLLGGRNFREDVTTNVDATGKLSEYKKSGNAGGTGQYSTATVACAFRSDPNEPQTGSSEGTLQTNPRPNPLLAVDWAIPDIIGQYGLKENCTNKFVDPSGNTVPIPYSNPTAGSEILPYDEAWAIGQRDHSFTTGCIGYVPPDKDFFKAFGGPPGSPATLLVPFKETPIMPDKPNGNYHVNIRGAGFNPSYPGCDAYGDISQSPTGSESYTVKIDSSLTFGLLKCPTISGTAAHAANEISFTPEPAAASIGLCRYYTYEKVNKLGILLLKDGLSILGGGGFVDGASAGKATLLLFPGMPMDGNASLDVAGHVVPGGAADRVANRRPASVTKLFSGKARAKNGRSWKLVLTPTAAGRRILGRHHKAIRVIATLTFKSTNKRQRPLKVTEAILLPATP